jgi:hypothetical protein
MRINKKRLEVQEMNIFRSLSGISRRDYIGKHTIRSDLEENSVGEDIGVYRQQWRDNLLEMDITRPSKIANYYKPKGKRDFEKLRKG